jgi:uncharacterized membrane protein
MLTPDISDLRDRFDMYEKEKAMHETTQRQRIVTFDEVAISVANADDTLATVTVKDVAVTTSTSPKETFVTVAGTEDSAAAVMSAVSGPAYTDIENDKWLAVDEATSSSKHSPARKGYWRCTIL